MTISTIKFEIKFLVWSNNLTKLVQGAFKIELCEVEIENKSNDLLVLEYQAWFHYKKKTILLLRFFSWDFFSTKNFEIIKSASRIKSFCIEMEISPRFVFYWCHREEAPHFSHYLHCIKLFSSTPLKSVEGKFQNICHRKWIQSSNMIAYQHMQIFSPQA